MTEPKDGHMPRPIQTAGFMESHPVNNDSRYHGLLNMHWLPSNKKGAVIFSHFSRGLQLLKATYSSQPDTFERRLHCPIRYLTSQYLYTLELE